VGSDEARGFPRVPFALSAFTGEAAAKCLHSTLGEHRTVPGSICCCVLDEVFYSSGPMIDIICTYLKGYTK